MEGSVTSSKMYIYTTYTYISMYIYTDAYIYIYNLSMYIVDSS